MNLALRPLALPLAVLAAAALTACGSSSKDTAAGQQTTTTTSSSSTPSPTPTPTPSAALSKAEFVSKMDAVCVDVTTKLQHLPQPTNEQDFTNIAASAQGTLALFPPYIKQAEALVAQTADKDSLTSNWLTVEKSDFAALQPALKKFIADVKAKNQPAVTADLKKLDAVPDHSETIASFMSGYGLKSCAILERS